MLLDYQRKDIESLLFKASMFFDNGSQEEAQQLLFPAIQKAQRFGLIDLEDAAKRSLVDSYLYQAISLYEKRDLRGASSVYSEAAASLLEYKNSFNDLVLKEKQTKIYTGWVCVACLIGREEHVKGNNILRNFMDLDNVIPDAIEAWKEAKSWYQKTLTIYEEAKNYDIELDETIKIISEQDLSRIETASKQWGKKLKIA